MHVPRLWPLVTAARARRVLARGEAAVGRKAERRAECGDVAADGVGGDGGPEPARLDRAVHSNELWTTSAGASSSAMAEPDSSMSDSKRATF